MHNTEVGGSHHCRPEHYWQETVDIVEHVSVAKETYRIRLACPTIAARIEPGQFIMMRLPGTNDPLLARPLALYDVVRDAEGTAQAIDIVYQAIGRMTRRLSTVAEGSQLEIWGPLGNGFPPVETEHLIMVAGGIGQTPFLAMAKHYLGLTSYGIRLAASPKAKRVSLCYGCRNADYFSCLDDFRAAGVELHLATDDGSGGYHGRVIDLIPPLVRETGMTSRVVACGPEKMLHATTTMAKELGLNCQVSLESPMACGIGICFSCVTKIRDAEGQWDYRRICVEGPVFDAECVEF
jgi:dihydroorotate dehydrogenase electron transfer subunit